MQQLRVGRPAARQPWQACSRCCRSRLRLRCAASPDGDEYKRAAAKEAVGRFLRSNTVVGLGSGDMVSYAIEELGRCLKSGVLQGITVVPACSVAAHEAAFSGVPLTTLDEHPRLDLYLEECDQVDLAGGGAYVKGVRSQPVQPQLPQAAAVREAAAQTVVLADAANVVARLRGSLPVAILAEEWEDIAEELDDIFLGDGELWRRPATGTANPRGGDQPYVSDDGCNIIDIRFYEAFRLYDEEAPYAAIAEEIEGVPGVVAHGLAAGGCDWAVVAQPSGGGEGREGEAGPRVVKCGAAAAAAGIGSDGSSETGG